MKVRNDSNSPSPENLWLPGVKRKARTVGEFVAWAECEEMKPVWDRLGSEALHMLEDIGPDQVAGKRGLWLLLAVEAVCRQQKAVQLEQGIEDEMAEGIGIINEMVLGAAGAYGRPAPLNDQEFWRSFIFGLCITWGGTATMLTLHPHHLYAVQIRRMKDTGLV